MKKEKSFFFEIVESIWFWGLSVEKGRKASLASFQKDRYNKPGGGSRIKLLFNWEERV